MSYFLRSLAACPIIEMENLSKDSKALYKLIQGEFSKFKTEVLEALKLKTTQITELQSEVKTLKDEVGKLKLLVDDADCYERRDTIILSGNKVPASLSGENCVNVVKSLVQQELKIEISPNDISTAHRLGRKPNTQGDDKRSLIVKLCRRVLKRDLIIASKKQARPIGLYVNESLTPPRQALLFALRQIKRAHPDILNGCTSLEGRVYAFTKPPSSARYPRDVRHLISTREDLQKFCNDYIKAPLETFVQNFSV